jgi:hypothetical protein
MKLLDAVEQFFESKEKTMELDDGRRLERNVVGIINLFDRNGDIITCITRQFIQKLSQEVTIKPKPVDWSKVEQGTLIRVSCTKIKPENEGLVREFVFYDEKTKLVCVYDGTNGAEKYIMSWKYAELIEG